MLFSLGSLIGPLLSGGLTVGFSYSTMNDIMGKSTNFVFNQRLPEIPALMTLISLVITVLFVGPRK